MMTVRTSASEGPGERIGIATFEDGYRANCIEAILESAKKGSVWTKVNYQQC
jgi:hypothetical protein